MQATDGAGASPRREVPAVIFPKWREMLNRASLPSSTRAEYAVAIAGYLDYCLRNGLSVTLESAQPERCSLNQE